MRADLEPHDLARRSFATLVVPVRHRVVAGPDAASLPAGPGIIDPAVETPSVAGWTKSRLFYSVCHLPATRFPEWIDTDKLAEAALAILSLTLHGDGRVWKSLD